MPWKTRCIDDTLFWDEITESAFWHTLDYAKNGIVFNPDKFQFARDEVEVEFASLLITTDGIKPTKKIIEAILNFPTPTNITGVRSYFRLVNQVSYTFSQAEVMAPFWELLHTKDCKFYWDANLESLFEESKKNIIQKIEEKVKTFKIEERVKTFSGWYPSQLTIVPSFGIRYFLF